MIPECFLTTSKHIPNHALHIILDLTAAQRSYTLDIGNTEEEQKQLFTHLGMEY